MTQPAAAQHFADPAAASAYAAYRQAQIEEHGQWEATETILVGSVPGWTVGHSVPASTVQANPWMVEQGLVRRVAPPPQPGVDRGEQLRARQAAIAAENAAIEAELAAAVGAGYGGMTIAELRAALGGLGLPTSGNKTELLERLHTAQSHRPAADDTKTAEE